MPVTPRTASRVLLLVVCLTTVSCEAIPLGPLGPLGPNGTHRGVAPVPIEEIQADVMAFADSYTAILAQAVDGIALELPDQRAALHDAKLRNVENAIIIAAGPNPVGALLDMTVMVTLQRIVAEEYWIPKQFGEAGRPLVDALRVLEEEIWLIADRSLDEEQLDALRQLIPEIRARFPNQVFVSSIRASDFAEDRRGAIAQLAGGGGSLLSLFRLDPLAGLSPASQELAQTRLLAERAFFWANRLPLILNWQLQDVILAAFDQPESQQLVEVATQLTESSRRISTVAEELLARLPEERAATLAQMNELMTAQRNATIDQLAAATAAEREALLAGVAAEREAILEAFADDDGRLRGALEELRQTVEATTTLSTSLTSTFESFDRMRAGLAPAASAPPPDPEQRPFDITDYKDTAEALTVTVAELNALMASLTETVASPAWDARSEKLTAAADHAQSRLEDLIDRAFRRGLILIGVLVGGALIAAVLYRLVAARLA